MFATLLNRVCSLDFGLLFISCIVLHACALPKAIFTISLKKHSKEVHLLVVFLASQHRTLPPGCWLANQTWLQLRRTTWKL